jgi:hypothetical protein
MLFSCCLVSSLLFLTECSHTPFLCPHTYIQAVPGLFAALARKRLDRNMLLDKTRLVLAEKELEVTKARADARVATADARVATADARVATAELETTKLRLQAKNLEVLRLANSVNLRGAIGKFVEGIVRVTHVSIDLPLPHSPCTIIHNLQSLFRKTRCCPFLASSPRPR